MSGKLPIGVGERRKVTSRLNKFLEVGLLLFLSLLSIASDPILDRAPHGIEGKSQDQHSSLSAIRHSFVFGEQMRR